MSENMGMEGAQDILKRIEQAEARRREEEAAWPKCPVCGRAFKDYCYGCEEDRQKAAEVAEQERKERDRDIKRLGGLKAYEQFTLARYANKEAIDRCEGYPDINLYLWGAAGVGKTHLATAIARLRTDAWIFKPQQIFRKCRGLKSGEEEAAVIEKFIKVPLLVIDDLGVDKKTDFSFSVLYEIIDGRDMAYRKGMIITSNLSLGALSERLGDDRITSRIAGMCRVVEIVGSDWRISNKGKI